MSEDKRKPAPSLDQIRPPSLSESRQTRQSSFEDRIVDLLCRRYKVPGVVRNRMRDAAEGLTGTPGLTFTVWYAMFPGYPVYFGTTVIANLLKTCTISKLFLDFGGRPLHEEYQVLLETVTQEAPETVALIFPWPHIAGPGQPTTGLVLHNRGWDRSVPGVRISWTAPDAGEETLCIEHLNVFLRGVDKDYPPASWLPKSFDHENF